MLHDQVLQTNIGKPSSRVIVSDFVYNTRSDSIKFLKQYLDVTGCEDVFNDPDTMSQLEGRARLVCNTITKINDTPSRTKSQVLRAAIHETYNKHLADGVVAAAKRLRDKKNASLLLNCLEKIAIACCTDNTSVFEVTERIDLMETGTCHIRKAQGSETYFYVVQEPLTADIIATVLDEYKTLASNQLLACWANQMVRQTHGKLFEKLCIAAMLQPGTLLRLIKNCDLYDRSGAKLSQQEKNKLEDGLGALQFQNVQTYRASDIRIPSLGEGNSEIYYNDQNFGPDFAGVGVISSHYYAVVGICKFIPKFDEHSVADDLKVMSCHHWNTTIEKALLLSCTLPTCDKVAVDYSKLKENELFISIGRENFHHLIGDEQVVSVVTSILDKQEVTSIENNIVLTGDVSAEVIGEQGVESIPARNDMASQKRTSISYIINLGVKLAFKDDSMEDDNFDVLEYDSMENLWRSNPVKIYLRAEASVDVFQYTTGKLFHELNQYVKETFNLTNPIIYKQRKSKNKPWPRINQLKELKAKRTYVVKEKQ
jgi:hypothetical protein